MIRTIVRYGHADFDQEVNSHLDNGWTLRDTFCGIYGDPMNGEEFLIAIMEKETNFMTERLCTRCTVKSKPIFNRDKEVVCPYCMNPYEEGGKE